jgi:GT2 family glycosyltransferase
LALKQSLGKYILLLNPDTKLSLNTLKVMHNYMELNPEVGISTCRVELADGKLDGACHRAFPTPWSAFSRFIHLSKKYPTSQIFNQYNLGYLDIKTVHEIDCCSGAFMLIRKSAIIGDALHDKVGFLDEDYWANGEDIDWCYRFKQSGWKVVFNPETKIIHYKGASSGTQLSTRDFSKADEKIKKKWINAFHDAMPIFYKKHYKNKYPFFVKWLVLFGVEVKRRIALKKLLNN